MIYHDSEPHHTSAHRDWEPDVAAGDIQARAQPAPSREAIRDSLTAIRPHGLQNLVAIVPDGPPTAKTFDLPRALDEAADWAATQNQAGKNLYFTVNPLTGKLGTKPTKADIANVEYAHVDIDPDLRDGYATGRARLLAETLPTLQAFAPPPALVIDSGNGLGAFWRLDSVTPEEAEDFNRRLIARFGGDPGTHNLDRLMRLPGTLNYPTAKKRTKGYPETPQPATLALSNPDACSAHQLASVLPPVQPMSAPENRAALAEDSTPLTPEHIAALDARLAAVLDQSPNLRRRWQGETDGLQDTSRSGLDFAVTALLKGAGFSYPETVHLLRHRFEHGKGTENTERDLHRNWTRCGTSAAPEIVALCAEAHGRGDPWEPILYAARPNAQAIDTVLNRLAGQPGFAGKRALKEDYDRHATTHDARATEAADLATVQTQAGNRLALLWDPTNLNDMVDRVEDALRTIPGKWVVLLYGGIHSRVAVKPPQHLHLADDPHAAAPSVPILEPYNPQAMLLRIEQSVSFFQQKDGRATAMPVPDRLPGLILNKPDPALPVTVGLVTHPLVLPSGELLIAEGLHAGSRIYAHFGGAVFAEPGAMTPAEGIALLRAEMLGEFAFAAAADAAAALALILTVIERKTLDMAPGFMVNASTQGSGKTTLARMAHLLVTGHDMPVAAMTESPDEQEKALTAMLLQSVPIVCFDNVPDAFKVASPALAKALTSPIHTGRILGVSKMAALPTNTVFVVTGNNITADIDLSRRLLEIRLAPKEARPEQRRFQHPDVAAHVLRNRSRWMQAALAILSGNRDAQPDAPPSGFQQWDRAVRWPLIHAGVADPVTKFDDVRYNSPDHERMTAWMLGLAHGFGVGTAFRAQDLVRQDRYGSLTPSATGIDDLTRRATMYADYLEGHPPPKGWTSVKSIGWMVNGLVGRTIEGYTLTTKKVRGTTHYTVARP